MARTTWEQTSFDRLVGAFLKRKGISPNDVRSYTIDRNGPGPGAAMIILEMYYDEPDDIDVTTMDQPPGSQFLPRVTTDNPNIIKEG